MAHFYSYNDAHTRAFQRLRTLSLEEIAAEFAEVQEERDAAQDELREAEAQNRRLDSEIEALTQQLDDAFLEAAGADA